MDFAIAGKCALVCAASKGLGKGCAAALVREGVNAVITARSTAALVRRRFDGLRQRRQEAAACESRRSHAESHDAHATNCVNASADPSQPLG